MNSCGFTAICAIYSGHAIVHLARSSLATFTAIHQGNLKKDPQPCILAKVTAIPSPRCTFSSWVSGSSMTEQAPFWTRYQPRAGLDCGFASGTVNSEAVEGFAVNDACVTGTGLDGSPLPVVRQTGRLSDAAPHK